MSASIMLLQEVEEAAAAAAAGKKNTMMLTNMKTGKYDFPEALVVDILSRLRVKTLMRFKSVCRSWYALISSDYYFAHFLHLSQSQRNNPRRVLIMPLASPQHELLLYSYDAVDVPKDCGPSGSKVHPIFRLRFPAPYNISYITTHISHCNGLVLICGTHDNMLVNLSTRLTIALPLPERKVKTVLAFVDCTQEYKLVRCFYLSCDSQAQTHSLCIEVFTLGNHSWMATPVDPPYPVVPKSAVSVLGSIYWRIDNRLHTSSPKAILRYDLYREEFKVIPPPPGPSFSDQTKLSCMKIVELQGNLCCYSGTSRAHYVYIDLWILKDNRNATNNCASWFKAYSVYLPDMPKVFKPIAVHDEEILLSVDHRLCYYYPRTQSIKVVIDLQVGLGHLDPRDRPCIVSYQVMNYVESLTEIAGLPYSLTSR